MIKIKVLLMIVFVIFGIISLIKGINLYEKIKKNKSRIHEAEMIFFLTSMICTTFISLSGALWIEISKEIF